ncbi:hypothetical protein ACSBR1_001201 [Camellia fascicularis]
MWLELLLLLLIAGLMLLLLLLAGLMLLQCCCEVKRDRISERMRKLRELVLNMDKGYEAQFAEEKQRNFKLMRNLNFIEELCVPMVLKVLGIPGEDLAGIHSAREFVWWYNGHPNCQYLALDLKNTDIAVILGQSSKCRKRKTPVTDDSLENQKDSISGQENEAGRSTRLLRKWKNGCELVDESEEANVDGASHTNILVVLLWFSYSCRYV